MAGPQLAAGGADNGATMDELAPGREAELEAVLAAPIEGGFAAGYQQKEAAVRAAFERLPAAECRVLAERLRRAEPEDPLAALFGRMTADRRGRLLAFLDGARRREAIRHERAERVREREGHFRG